MLTSTALTIQEVGRWGGGEVGRWRWGGGCGGKNEGTGIKWASHLNRIINIMLSDLPDLLLF